MLIIPDINSQIVEAEIHVKGGYTLVIAPRGASWQKESNGSPVVKELQITFHGPDAVKNAVDAFNKQFPKV